MSRPSSLAFLEWEIRVSVWLTRIFLAGMTVNASTVS